MPTYEYVCNKCHSMYEIKQSFDDAPITHCNCCGQESLKRKISAAAIVYKGPGFATTDARGITGKKRKPNIKIGTKSDLSPAEQERMT